MKHRLFAQSSPLIILATLTLSWPAFAMPAFTVGFSPSHSARVAVLDVINQTKNTLYMEAYSFTDKGIAQALVAAKQRGVSVRVVADKKSNSDSYTSVTFLANQGIPIRLNDNYSIMHNKIILADSNTLQTGSYNYSASANKRNAENVLVVRNQPQLVAVYEQEFERLWQESQPLLPKY
ncbi:phospholipase D family protein [Yersinia enterocolitica]